MARALLRPAVEAHLLTAERERVVDQLPRHWVTRLPGVGAVVAGMVLLLTMPLVRQWWPACLAAGLLAGLAGFWLILRQELERFVVTNLRVFRVNGVIDQNFASMPLSRVLDIAMQRPFWGQIFGYAEFVFESAAQDQGLREIHFVGAPDARLHLFQRVVISAGLTGRVQADIASGD